MLLKIRYYGDPILRKKAEEVTEITAEIKQLIEDMIETMDANNGLGLAAPQVGHSLRIFVVRNYIETESGELTLSDPFVYINPRLHSPSAEKLIDFEGCLSIPGIRAKVERPESISVEAIDFEGNPFSEELSGYNARSRMHENDHLNGVLYVDRLSPKDKRKVEPQLESIKKKSSKAV